MIRIVELQEATLAAVNRDAAVITDQTVVSIGADTQSAMGSDALLAWLSNAKGVEDERAILREIDRHAQALDDLARAFLREQMIMILREHGRSS